MLQLIKFMVNLIISLIVLTLVINIPTVFMKYNMTKKIENTMVKYAQKNGGFIITEDFDPKEILEYSIAVNGLENEVTNIKVKPNYGVIAQRHSEVEIEMTLNTEIDIPFSEAEIEIKIPVSTKGYSHKYFKGN